MGTHKFQVCATVSLPMPDTMTDVRRKGQREIAYWRVRIFQHVVIRHHVALMFVGGSGVHQMYVNRACLTTQHNAIFQLAGFLHILFWVCNLHCASLWSLDDKDGVSTDHAEQAQFIFGSHKVCPTHVAHAGKKISGRTKGVCIGQVQAACRSQAALIYRTYSCTLAGHNLHSMRSEIQEHQCYACPKRQKIDYHFMS